MAKGTESKNIIFNKLQEVYPNAFFEDEGKILRIPLTENGERVEIKVTLTAAKTNLGEGLIGAFASADTSIPQTSSINTPTTSAVNIEMTQEEKDNVINLLNALGM